MGRQVQDPVAMSLLLEAAFGRFTSYEGHARPRARWRG